jgi:hypothetical protein
VAGFCIAGGAGVGSAGGPEDDTKEGSNSLDEEECFGGPESSPAVGCSFPVAVVVVGFVGVGVGAGLVAGVFPTGVCDSFGGCAGGSFRSILDSSSVNVLLEADGSCFVGFPMADSSTKTLAGSF